MVAGLSLHERLEQARRRQFVGRVGERDRLRAVLSEPELPFFVLHIFGPGGLGKTSLLREYGYIARELGIQSILLDGRNFDASPAGFLAMLGYALGLPAGGDPAAALAERGERLLLLVDTYELLNPIDNWLREEFLPGLSGNVFVVLAGRQPPAAAWRTDPGWQTMMRILPLRNLSPSESRDFLARRHVPTEQSDRILDFTHGHALALSLVADFYDQGSDVDFRPEAAPDIVRALLEEFVQQAPSPAHRAALEACAMVRLTTETLLATLLDQSDAHDLFAWLRGLSFIESEPRGLFPHDLAREALVADVRWRNPDWYAELHRRARAYYMPRVQRGPGQEQRRLLADYVYLHRDNPSVRPYFQWQESGEMFTDGLRPGDLEELSDIVEQHEGHESAALAAHWIARQPEGVSILRGSGGVVVGFVIRVNLEATTPADRALDPAIGAAWAALMRKPLRSGETAAHFRFWMTRDGYQGVSPEENRLVFNIVQYYLTAPGLAYTFLPCADPDFWDIPFQYADLNRMPEADFTAGGRRYGVYGHDWRVTPPLAWLELLAERELSVGGRPASRPATEPIIVLSEAEFATAVRDALRDYTDTAALLANPLLRSRLVLGQAGTEAAPAARIAALRKLLRETAESLQDSPKLIKFHRALYHTYLQPAATQEQAAEVLDLPFSTYRRHLRSGIEEVTGRLWLREIGNLEA
ncbi:MAG: hypothetical protein K1X50_14925 [Candidatus Promineofilum sp.]|nr:hypothetical protein [Promineifilum sp.]